MSRHNNPENRDPKLLPVVIEKKQDQDTLDMTRAEDEGFNEPAQRESLEEAAARERQAQLKQNQPKKK